MEVPFLDLKGQYDGIREELIRAVVDVLDSGQVVCNGPAVRELEKQVAAYSHTAAAVGVSSGTDALLCSLMALGIGAGHEVITTPFTFFASAGVISRTGARPVFVDIEAETFNIDPDRISSAITERTKAILPVHLYGQMADMDRIMAIASQHGLYVIEDAAQAIGAEQNGRKAGALGTVGCFSFYPTKNLGAIGDAGMIVTQDEQLAWKLTKFLDHGQEPKYHYKWIGGNFRMDSIQAAALAVKMRHLDAWTASRRANAAMYDELLADCEAVSIPAARRRNLHVYNLYVIRTPRRDELQMSLKAQGIAAAVYYPMCLHQQECFKDLGYREGDFPVAERAAAEVLALPIYPELGGERIHYVAGRIKQFFS